VQPDQLRTVMPYAIGIVVLVVVMAFRLRRMSQTRPLKVEWLWVTPVLLTVLTVVSLIPQPPEGLGWAWLAGGLVVGGALGWYRGKMMHILVDPETHAINTKASPAAMIFIVALIVIRMALRGVAMTEASTLHLSVAVITGAFMTFAIGLFGVQRLEMALRATRLLKEARAAKAV